MRTKRSEMKIEICGDQVIIVFFNYISIGIQLIVKR